MQKYKETYIGDEFEGCDGDTVYELDVVDDNSSSLDEKKRLTQRQEIVSVSSPVQQR